ncbi:hypothetical protein KAJ27_23815, partial [bacterium]|nr:hypothetical protein [bacterium]
GDKSHAELVGTGYSHSFGNAGGESSVISYGPYDMAIGDSIHIVFVEGGAGIHRAFSTDEKDPRFEIGNNWYKRIIKKETLTGLQYPDYASGGSLTSIDLDSDANADLYKDAWVYTGRDSLLQSFKYAYNLYNNSGFEIPDDEKAPVAPQEFLLEAYSRSIRLTWTDEINVVNNNFSGYKIYRAVGDYKYTKYDLVVDLSYSNGGLSEGKTTFTYDDKTVTRGQKYYYTIVAYDNGDNAFAKVLTSQAHLTRTNIGVSLSTPGANAMDNIRIVPNPWNEKMQVLQYAGSANKYMLQFVNLPDVCHIRVFNTRGDLIKKLEHEKGSEERWNLSTDYNQIISSGVYIVQFEAVEDVYSDQNELSISKGEVVNKKLVVIR